MNLDDWQASPSPHLEEMDSYAASRRRRAHEWVRGWLYPAMLRQGGPMRVSDICRAWPQVRQGALVYLLLQFPTLFRIEQLNDRNYMITARDLVAEHRAKMEIRRRERSRALEAIRMSRRPCAS